MKVAFERDAWVVDTLYLRKQNPHTISDSLRDKLPKSAKILSDKKPAKSEQE